jgi:uncharacterized protein YjbI with pentapeptide repeats
MEKKYSKTLITAITASTAATAAIVAVISFLIFALGFKHEWLNFGLNLSTEVIGILVSTAITYFIVDRFTQQKIEQENLTNWIIDIRSGSKNVAFQAIAHLKFHPKQHLKNGALCSSDMRGANLTGAKLHDADLRWVDLRGAKLEKTNLSRAKLQGAHLGWSNMQNALLEQTNLQSGHLERADLRNACLEMADLTNAHIEGANLTGAKLRNAHFDWAKLQDAIMPDGQPWTPETDLRRFTDPNHPDFFNPDA